MEYETKAICVDFDGVIAEFVDDIGSFGRVLPGAREALAELREAGYRIIIHTARPSAPEPMQRLADYLTSQGIPFDEINTNSSCPWPAGKPVADLYIDDRALRFEGDWPQVLAKARQHLGLAPGPAREESYGDLLQRVVDRAREVACFEKFLRDETAWPTAPASTRFHLAKEGGLVEHSLNVTRTLLQLRQSLAPDLSAESCVIAGLYHDVGKIGGPGQPYYLPNPDGWQVRHRGIPYIINRELVHLDLATRSLTLVLRHIPLSDEESQAIRYHDGQYVPENQSVAHRETRLTRLLQYADNWSGGVLEDRDTLGH